MNYIVSISPLHNVISVSDKDFFLGTGFFGEEVSSHAQLKELILKYAVKERSEGRCILHDFRLTFCTPETVQAIKAAGNRQCKETGMVNLFTAVAPLQKDPFNGLTLYFKHSGWTCEEHPEVFHWVVDKRGSKPAPWGGKLSELLPTLGIVF